MLVPKIDKRVLNIIIHNMKYWDKLTNSTYAKLMEYLESEIGLPSSGTIIEVSVNNETYNQLRVSYMNKRVVFYLGKNAPEMKERLRRRKELCSVLAAHGCNRPDRDSASTLELLDAAGCFFGQNAVLIGSHAFAVIGNALGVTWQSDIVETQDIDLGRQINLAGKEGIDLKDKLIQAGFQGIPSLDHRHPPTSFRHQKGMVIDFLTPMVGRPKEMPVKLTGMEVYADEMPFLDYLIDDPIRGAAITPNGLLVLVPQPARYAFHKCILATRRGAAKEHKRKKDVHQAEALFTVLLEMRSHDIQIAWNALNSSWQKHARAGIEMLNESLKDELLETIEKQAVT